MPKLKIAGIIALVLILGAAALWWFKFNHNSGSNLKNVDNHLTSDQKKIYTDKIAQAEAHLKQIPANSSGKTEAADTYVFLGQQYFGLGQLNKSVAEYNLSLKIDPMHETALLGLAQTLEVGGDKNGASSALEKVVTNDPNNPDAWLQYIDIRQALGDTNQQLDSMYTQALAGTSRNINVLTKDAEFQEKIGNIGQAISIWQEAGRTYPDNAVIYNAEAARLQATLK